MKITFILKDLSEVFYKGNQLPLDHPVSIVGLEELEGNMRRFMHLKDKAAKRELKITMKIGNGSFRDRVELNQILRSCYCKEYRLENRRGYKLATFEIEKMNH